MSYYLDWVHFDTVSLLYDLWLAHQKDKKSF